MNTPRINEPAAPDVTPRVDHPPVAHHTRRVPELNRFILDQSELDGHDVLD
jgi:hypothetical protein